MTVKELIDELKKHDEDTILYVRGFDEGGLDDIGPLRTVRVVRDINPPGGHFGQHDDVTNQAVDDYETGLLINFE